MSFKSSALRITTAIALTFAATAASAGELAVTQVSPDTFHYTVATPANGKVDAGRVEVMRDARKLATAMGADGYSIVNENVRNVGGSVVRNIDIKLNAASGR